MFVVAGSPNLLDKNVQTRLVESSITPTEYEPVIGQNYTSDICILKLYEPFIFNGKCRYKYLYTVNSVSNKFLEACQPMPLPSSTSTYVNSNSYCTLMVSYGINNPDVLNQVFNLFDSNNPGDIVIGTLNNLILAVSYF